MPVSLFGGLKTFFEALYSDVKSPCMLKSLNAATTFATEVHKTLTTCPVMGVIAGTVPAAPAPYAGVFTRQPLPSDYVQAALFAKLKDGLEGSWCNSANQVITAALGEAMAYDDACCAYLQTQLVLVAPGNCGGHAGSPITAPGPAPMILMACQMLTTMGQYADLKGPPGTQIPKAAKMAGDFEKAFKAFMAVQASLSVGGSVGLGPPGALGAGITVTTVIAA